MAENRPNQSTVPTAPASYILRQKNGLLRIIAHLGIHVIDNGAMETDINGGFLKFSMETRNTSIRSAIISVGYKITK